MRQGDISNVKMRKKNINCTTYIKNYKKKMLKITKIGNQGLCTFYCDMIGTAWLW